MNQKNIKENMESGSWVIASLQNGLKTGRPEGAESLSGPRFGSYYAKILEFNISRHIVVDRTKPNWPVSVVEMETYKKGWHLVAAPMYVKRDGSFHWVEYLAASGDITAVDEGYDVENFYTGRYLNCLSRMNEAIVHANQKAVKKALESFTEGIDESEVKPFEFVKRAMGMSVMNNSMYVPTHVIGKLLGVEPQERISLDTEALESRMASNLTYTREDPQE